MHVRQGAGCQDIDVHSEQLSEFLLDGADIEQGGGLRRFHQQVEVAVLRVLTPGSRAEDAHVPDTVPQRDLPHATAVLGKDFRGTHDGILASRASLGNGASRSARPHFAQLSFNPVTLLNTGFPSPGR